MPILLDLFLTFAKIGMFTFGGGYAMISLIENTCVENKKWITHDEMMTLTVIAESTPGPIAINCATYVGYKKGKIPGAIASTLWLKYLNLYVLSSSRCFGSDFWGAKDNIKASVAYGGRAYGDEVYSDQGYNKRRAGADSKELA